MKNPYRRPRGPGVIGLAFGSILALILAMTLSIAFDIQPTEFSQTNMAVSSTA